MTRYDDIWGRCDTCLKSERYCECNEHSVSITRCDGCKKSFDTCMCKTVLPMDYSDLKELKKTVAKKLAEELRETAARALDTQTKNGAEQMIRDVIIAAKKSASNGKFELEWRFNTYHTSVASAELAVISLREQGFTASCHNQTYSSGSQDYTHVIRVSWK